MGVNARSCIIMMGVDAGSCIIMLRVDAGSCIIMMGVDAVSCIIMMGVCAQFYYNDSPPVPFYRVKRIGIKICDKVELRIGATT